MPPADPATPEAVRRFGGSRDMPADGTAYPEDVVLLARLKRGDASAFTGLVDTYGASLLRLASQYVGDRSLAEEVVQETWTGFLESLDRFEGRASLKTWIFRILVNQARKRSAREARSIPFSALGDGGGHEPSVDPDRFRRADRPGTGCWASPPRHWNLSPEQQVLSQEIYQQVADALQTLPPSQREVVTLRDIEGWPSDEVCNVLEISENNQRVLLHRARSKLRGCLESYLDRTDR